MRSWHVAAFMLGLLALFSGLFDSGASVLTSSDHSQSRNFLVGSDALWRYKAGTAKSMDDWRQLDYDDTHWRAGKAGFGYGDDSDRTDLADMHGEYAALRIRQQFNVEQPAQIKKLYLYIRFDDAFIAYLNGEEIARSHVTDDWNGRTIESHEASSFERFSVHDAIDLLHEGRNVLAIVGFNRSLDSSDFVLHPVLTTKRTKNPGLTLSLTPAQMLADIDYLQQRLEDQSSYLQLRPEFDHEKELDEIRQSVGSQTTPLHFARLLAKLIAQLGDAHAEVKAWLDEPTDKFLPFRLADTVSGIVAVSADGETLLNDDFPKVRSIDNTTIEEWLAAASQYVPRASSQLVRRESLRELRSIDRIREVLDLPTSHTVKVTLESADQSKSIDVQLDTLATRLPSGKVKLGDSRVLEGNIGYLRIPGMYPDGTEQVVEGMAAFRGTEGLVIDVRGNRGGYYPILFALYGYFLGDTAPPYVANIAAYRLSSRFGRDHLEDRPTYRANYSGWSSAEKAAIAAAIDRFQPEWRFPPRQFSDWHFMLLDESASWRQYHYTKPVVVLSDAASYSATDLFLSALSDLPDVTLIGGPSAGGSGATETFVLPHSGLQIALSSMASYRPNGRLFDRNGIDVDVEIIPTANDFLGHSDTVLQRAVEWIEQIDRHAE
jgi:hypothetical protein